MPSQNNNVDLSTDKILSKSRILQELTEAVKIVYAQSLYGSVVLDRDSWLVYWLDRALRHGLRTERHGYWGIARDLSHQDTVVVIHALQNVLTSIGKGRAWLYHTLSEGSFESYLACLLRDTKILNKQYLTHALLRDADSTNQLVNLLAGLENISFTLQLDVSHLDTCNYIPHRPMSGVPSGVILSLHLRNTDIPLSFSSANNEVSVESDTDISHESHKNFIENKSNGNINEYLHRKELLDLNMNDNLQRSFKLFNSHEQKVSPKNIAKYHSLVTKNDILNQNLTHDLNENIFNGVVKNSNYCNQELDDSEYNQTCSDIENHGVRNYNFKSLPCEDVSFSFKKRIDPRNSYIINNDTNLLELSMTISDSDNIEVPYGILNTVNVTDSSILSSSYSDTFIQRRVRKKKRGETKKRVSFHEDIFKMMKLDDDENYNDYCMSFAPGSVPNSVQNKHVPRDRHSWCSPENDTSFHTAKQSEMNKNNCSDYYSSTSTLSLIDNGNFSEYNSRNENCIPRRLSLSERGVPEGQEDPFKSLKSHLEFEMKENEAHEAFPIEEEFDHIVEDPPIKSQMPNKLPSTTKRSITTSSDWSDIESVTNSDIDDKKHNRHLSSPCKKRNTVTTAVTSNEHLRLSTGPLKQMPSKSSLIGRFLRSITERKFDIKKDRKKIKKQLLKIKGVQVDPTIVKDFNDRIESEFKENFPQKNQEYLQEYISSNLREIFRQNIYRDKTEELYKAYKIRSSYMTNGESKPMIALLTNKTLYLTATKFDHSYSNQFVIPYNELDVIMIGPNAQTILISNADYEMQYLFSTGSKKITSEFIGHLELAMRRSPLKPRLPAIKELGYNDMHTLKYSILNETAVNSNEQIEHYSLIYLEDEHISPPSTPCGPLKEGDLMYRYHMYSVAFSNPPKTPWEAGYFVLKGGVIYAFADNNQRLPKQAIPLKGGACQGCRRIPNSHRPHTFEILLKSNKAIQFAAPDEYVASEWLQSLIQCASGLYDPADNKTPLPCSLVTTTKHLIVMKELFPESQRGEVLSCASIEDLSAFKISLSRQFWCILEFSCREVHENSGDWIVYFTNCEELGAFQEILEKLWNKAKLGDFPIFKINSDDKIHERCLVTSRSLEEAWKYLIPNDINLKYKS